MSEDTLFEDASGSAVSLFEAIRGAGLIVAVRLLDMVPPDNDETSRLLAIEVICAACGQPSTSEGCQYILEWCEQNPANADDVIKEKILFIIDGIVARQGESEAAEKMRTRVKNLD